MVDATYCALSYVLLFGIDCKENDNFISVLWCKRNTSNIELILKRVCYTKKESS